MKALIAQNVGIGFNIVPYVKEKSNHQKVKSPYLCLQPPGSTQTTTSKYPTPQYMQATIQQMAPGAYPNNMNNMTQSMSQLGVQVGIGQLFIIHSSDLFDLYILVLFIGFGQFYIVEGDIGFGNFLIV